MRKLVVSATSPLWRRKYPFACPCHYTLDIAGGVRNEGIVEIFDIQQEMLDHTMRRAGGRGISNIRPTRGDAQSLPYEDGSFDAAAHKAAGWITSPRVTMM